MAVHHPSETVRILARTWRLMVVAALVWGCGIRLAENPAPPANTATPSLPPATAPPPILYPPRDPSATYPVIRTWSEVLEFQAYPYLEPLPPTEVTKIDGVYGKVEPGDPQWWR